MRELILILAFGAFFFVGCEGDTVHEGDTINNDNEVIEVIRDITGYDRNISFKAVDINGTTYDMQFIGYDEVNGSEIYEGDVIDFFGNPATVVYHNYGFKAEIGGQYYDIEDIAQLRLLK